MKEIPYHATLTPTQKVAFMFNLAYSELCSCVFTVGFTEDISKEDRQWIKEMREYLHSQYKRYDPDNSFDIKRAYESYLKERITPNVRMGNQQHWLLFPVDVSVAETQDVAQKQVCAGDYFTHDRTGVTFVLTR